MLESGTETLRKRKKYNGIAESINTVTLKHLIIEHFMNILYQG